ncbi:MAG: hypothetical protein U9N35_00255 [Euryarchaeota archaeon]|nr:hypothetical protein [Euryarchaeota archaeon]
MSKTRELVKKTVRFVIVIVVLGILYEILPDLPGVDDIPFPGRLGAEDVCCVLVAFVAIVVLLQYGRNISTPIKKMTSSQKVGEFFKDIVSLIATVITYKVFRVVAEAYISDYIWAYSLIFVLIGVVLAIRILRSLLGSVDTITDAIMGEK